MDIVISYIVVVIVALIVGYSCGKIKEKRRCQKKTKEVQRFMEDIFFKAVWDDLVELLELVAGDDKRLHQRVGVLIEASGDIYQRYTSCHVFSFLNRIYNEINRAEWKKVVDKKTQYLISSMTERFEFFYKIQDKAISVNEYGARMHGWYKEFTIQQVAIKKYIKEMKAKVEE